MVASIPAWTASGTPNGELSAGTTSVCSSANSGSMDTGTTVTVVEVTARTHTSNRDPSPLSPGRAARHSSPADGPAFGRSAPATAANAPAGTAAIDPPSTAS